jgi:hypothetical protein
MLRNISKGILKGLGNNTSSTKFERIVKFIEWSEVEAEMLGRFERWLHQ